MMMTPEVQVSKREPSFTALRMPRGIIGLSSARRVTRSRRRTALLVATIVIGAASLGIGLILASVAAMAFADALVKLASANLTLWQIFVVRSIFALPPSDLVDIATVEPAVWAGGGGRR